MHPFEHVVVALNFVQSFI